MNRKRTLVVIAVLLVALVSTSYIVLATIEEPQKKAEETQAVNESLYMFVLTAHSGSLVLVEGNDNLYSLTLEGVSPQTIYFSDRPERDVGQVEMQKFLDALVFSSDNPPNAAIEILEGDEEWDVAVIELFDPVYDVANKTLQYNISFLEVPDHSHAIFNERHNKSLPENFGSAALFIDDCGLRPIYCYKDPQKTVECGSIKVKYCWKPFGIGERECDPCLDNYSDTCKKNFGPDCRYWNWDWLS